MGHAVRFEQLRPGQDHPSSGSPDSRIDTAEGETGRRVVDGIVGNPHIGGPGTPAKVDDPGHRIGMGCGPQHGRRGKGGIDLDQHPVAGGDKGGHAPQSFHGPGDGLLAILAAGHGQFAGLFGQTVIRQHGCNGSAAGGSGAIMVPESKPQGTGTHKNSRQPCQASQEFATRRC